MTEDQRQLLRDIRDYLDSGSPENEIDSEIASKALSFTVNILDQVIDNVPMTDNNILTLSLFLMP